MPEIETLTMGWMVREHLTVAAILSSIHVHAWGERGRKLEGSLAWPPVGTWTSPCQALPLERGEKGHCIGAQPGVGLVYQCISMSRGCSRRLFLCIVETKWYFIFLKKMAHVVIVKLITTYNDSSCIFISCLSCERKCTLSCLWQGCS